MITQAERRELRSVIRQQFKVLREEIEQRRAELIAEAAEKIRRRYAAADKQVDDLNWQVTQITDQANKDIRDAIQAAQSANGDGGKWVWEGAVRAPRVGRTETARTELRTALIAGIHAQAHQALLSLQRQEADLLRQLALGALESEEARQFLKAIPTVGDLVPAARLLEIEAEFDAQAGQ